ncbi:MAG: ABC transporter ATP-binding protein [Clostridia bacterium]|nr:ABC transporter ATP-binding protein [Clostridia bacterium]
MNVLLRLLRYSRPYRRSLAIGLGGLVVGTAMDLSVPYITRHVIDFVLREGHHAWLPWLAAAVVGVAAVKGTFWFFQRYAMAYMSQRIIFDIRGELYAHLQALSFRFYDRAQTGQIMSRVAQDVELLRRFMGFGLLMIANQLLLFAAVLVYLFWIDPFLTALVLPALPLLGLVIVQFNRRVRPKYQEIQQRQAEITAILQENVTGVRVVRAFTAEPFEIEKFGRANWRYLEQNLEAMRERAFWFPLMSLATDLGTVLAIGVGGWRVISGAITLGALVAFLQLLGMLFFPLRQLGWLVNMASRAIAAATRVFDLLDERPEVAERPGARRLPTVRGEVVFERVRFRYSPDAPWALDDVSFRVEPGETIALLGTTGSGKSTVMHLIPRFYDVDEGRVLVDGHDVRDLKLADLRRHIGIVPQETFLFSASIAENIAYGRPGATREEIVAAAKAAQIHDFIMSLPQGYDTVVGERGVGLSGGQKQRVAIARALLLDPRILILDEATSSVDTKTEELIREALRRLMAGRTSFVVAHRASTVRLADRVLVLDQGRIVQMGTPAELEAQPGLFREIVRLQEQDAQHAGAASGRDAAS